MGVLFERRPAICLNNLLNGAEQFKIGVYYWIGYFSMCSLELEIFSFYELLVISIFGCQGYNAHGVLGLQLSVPRPILFRPIYAI